jgi:hypothetical protein
MKLYTEEQVRKALLIGMNIGYSNNFNLRKLEQETDKAMIHLTPIELPTWDDVRKAISMARETEYGLIKSKDEIIEQLKQDKK